MSEPTSPPDDPATVTVNGLEMPPALWLRVMAAVRGLFPQETFGLSDAAAVQAVMRGIVIDWLCTWEAREAAPDPGEAARLAQQQAMTAINEAMTKARDDAAVIAPTVTS